MRPIIVTILASGLAAMLATGCDRPTEEDCREAVLNIRQLTELQDRLDESDVEAAVRSCRANATASSVACVRDATTVAELTACEAEVTEEVEEAVGGEAESGDEPAGDQPAGDDPDDAP